MLIFFLQLTLTFLSCGLFVSMESFTYLKHRHIVLIGGIRLNGGGSVALSAEYSLTNLVLATFHSVRAFSLRQKTIQICLNLF